MREKELKKLLHRYRLGTATNEEKAFLESWYSQYMDNDGTEYTLHQRMEDANAIWNTLNLVQGNPKHRLMWIRIAAAATILFFLSFGIYYSTKETAPLQLVKNKIYDMPPGAKKAILTLQDGKHIILDQQKPGILAIQGNVIITKTGDGQITYSNANKDVPYILTREAFFNKITIPRGGEYEVILSDGSHVWLNSASSISYPLAFAANKRQVNMTGEAYFEVSKNPEKPFIVNVNNKQQIRVLGTHFNVMAYSDDHVIQTTLIEGSVKLSTSNFATMLKPGQQGALKESQNFFSVNKVDTGDFIAWKNGLFIFNYENIQDMMKKISRWYNVDVVYNGNVRNISFVGNYSKNKPLSKLLKYIALSKKVHFLIEERRITVIAN